MDSQHLLVKNRHYQVSIGNQQGRTSRSTHLPMSSTNGSNSNRNSEAIGHLLGLQRNVSRPKRLQHTPFTIKTLTVVQEREVVQALQRKDLSLQTQ